MALPDLTSQDAVLRALAEFDTLGRDAFLAKYGFRRARGYFLVQDGRSYDSKAIAGAAHGYQHPELGPLNAAEFSGGNATVRARLEALGFTVVVTEPTTGPVPRCGCSMTIADGKCATSSRRLPTSLPVLGRGAWPASWNISRASSSCS